MEYKSPFMGCMKSFPTERGLGHHKRKMHAVELDKEIAAREAVADATKLWKHDWKDEERGLPAYINVALTEAQTQR